jgi:phage gp36-like protein
MAYCTTADLVAEFGEPALVQLTDIDEPAAGAVVTARADAAIARASDEADGYLGTRYAVPLDAAPLQLQGVVRDLAYFYLHRLGAPEQVVAAADRARAWLRDVAAARVSLAGAAPAAAAPTAGLAEIASAERLFSRGARAGL